MHDVCTLLYIAHAPRMITAITEACSSLKTLKLQITATLKPYLFSLSKPCLFLKHTYIKNITDMYLILKRSDSSCACKQLSVTWSWRHHSATPGRRARACGWQKAKRKIYTFMWVLTRFHRWSVYCVAADAVCMATQMLFILLTLAVTRTSVKYSYVKSLLIVMCSDATI